MRGAYYALHYGIEYLEWSIRSVADVVDVVVVSYSAKPTCGTDGSLPLPEAERESELYAAAKRGVDGRKAKLVWHTETGRFFEYGKHCDSAQAIAKQLGVDVAVNVDADEVWVPEQLRFAFDLVEARHSEAWASRRYTVPFIHFWRSFRWACADESHPIRLHDLRVDAGGPLDAHPEYLALDCPVLHFGYAQRLATMRYKWGIHGHRNELRPRWFAEKFEGWTPGVGDVHPVMEKGFWTPEPIGEGILLVRDLLKGHPYFWLDAEGRLIR